MTTDYESGVRASSPGGLARKWSEIWSKRATTRPQLADPFSACSPMTVFGRNKSARLLTDRWATAAGRPGSCAVAHGRAFSLPVATLHAGGLSLEARQQLADAVDS